MTQEPIVGSVPTRIATKEKQARDIKQLKKYARYVIVISASGIVEVIDNGHLVEKQERYAPLIVVIGLACQDNAIDEVVLLEIGYHRARPYSRVHQHRNRVLLFERIPARALIESEMRIIFPQLMECFEQILLETRKHWKIKDRWWPKNGGHERERGVQFTVRITDQWLYQQFLRQYTLYMGEYVMRKYARWISGHLRHCSYNRYSGKYPRKAREVWSSLKGSSYIKNSLMRETLLQRIGPRTLVESILRDVGGLTLDWDNEMELVFGRGAFVIGNPLPHLQIYKTPDQPRQEKGAHAKNCARFEVMFERNWREEHEPGNKPRFSPTPQQEVQVDDYWEPDENWVPVHHTEGGDYDDYPF
jgi:hypothetical protein